MRRPMSIASQNNDLISIIYKVFGEGTKLISEWKESDNIDIIGIDEAQFFDESIIDVSNNLAKEGKRIIVAGLDRDYKAIPLVLFMPSQKETAEEDKESIAALAKRVLGISIEVN